MPDPGSLVRAVDIPVPAPAHGIPRDPITVFDDGIVRVTDRPRDPRPRPPRPRLPVRHPGRSGGVLRRHHGERRPDRTRPRTPTFSSTRLRTSTTSSATASPGPTSIEWPDCRPTSTTSAASPNAPGYGNSSSVTTSRLNRRRFPTPSGPSERARGFSGRTIAGRDGLGEVANGAVKQNDHAGRACSETALRPLQRILTFARPERKSEPSLDSSFSVEPRPKGQPGGLPPSLPLSVGGFRLDPSCRDQRTEATWAANQ